jgi:hypothetical protein
MEEVQWNCVQLRVLAKAQAVTTPINNHRFGEISSAILTIEGACMEASLSATMMSNNNHVMCFFKVRIGRSGSYNLPGFEMVVYTDSEGITQELCNAESGIEVELMLIARSIQPLSEPSTSSYLIFRCIDIEKKTYERIGYLKQVNSPEDSTNKSIPRFSDDLLVNISAENHIWKKLTVI